MPAPLPISRLVRGNPLTSAITQNTFTIPFNVSWEADVFGGLRRNAESSNALYQSSAAALENVRLVVTSDLAVDYFSLRELDAEIAVVDSAVDYQGKALKLVQNRHEAAWLPVWMWPSRKRS